MRKISSKELGQPNSDSVDSGVASGAPRVARRTLVLGVTAAGAGMATALVAGADPALAAEGGAVLLGESNTAKGTTSITTKKGVGLQATTSADSSIGLSGTDASSGGGVAVQGTSTNGFGVLGSTDADGPAGVAGVNSSPDGGYGVQGVSSAGTGVYGSGNYGVAGDGTDEPGIAGYSENSFGVYAVSGNANALQVEGDADVTGSISKGGGSFRIDHPLDPAGKYLYHSFVESPDMMNVYNGIVALDTDGRATIALPAWFESLNRDCRYQLTAIGAPSPDLHISGEMFNGRFSVAGGSPGQKVSWQVTGIRQDAWANANRIPVELDKPAKDKGRYVHPELVEGGEPITGLNRRWSHRR